MNRHWTIYIHSAKQATNMAQSEANITRTDKNVLTSWDYDHNMPRYRVGYMPDPCETVCKEFHPER